MKVVNDRYNERKGAEYDLTGKQRLPISPAIGTAMKVMLHWHKTGKVKHGKAEKTTAQTWRTRATTTETTMATN